MTAGIARGPHSAGSPRIASTATRASAVALCASPGSPATSPIAEMCGTAVRRCRSTGMNPFASSDSPAFSSPRFTVFGRRPTETSTRSKVSSAGTSFPSSATTMPSWVGFRDATFVFV